MSTVIFWAAMSCCNASIFRIEEKLEDGSDMFLRNTGITYNIA
jgi:hypothetical protein